MDIRLSSNLDINVWLSSDFLMDIWLSSDLLMDVRLSSWVQVSISNRGIINSSIDSANWGSSIGYCGSSNSGNWSSSCVSIGIWVSIAIVGSWGNSSRG